MPVPKKGSSVPEGSGGPSLRWYFSKPTNLKGEGVALREVSKVPSRWSSRPLRTSEKIKKN